MTNYLQLPNPYLQSFLCKQVQLCVCFRRTQDAKKSIEPRLQCFAMQIVKILINSDEFNFHDLPTIKFHGEILDQVYEDLSIQFDKDDEKLIKDRQRKRLYMSLNQNGKSLQRHQFIRELVKNARSQSKCLVHDLVTKYRRLWFMNNLAKDNAPRPELKKFKQTQHERIRENPKRKAKSTVTMRYQPDDFTIKRKKRKTRKSQDKSSLSPLLETSDNDNTCSDPNQNLQGPREFFVFDHTTDSIKLVNSFEDLAQNFVTYNDFLHYSNEYNFTFMTKTFFRVKPQVQKVLPCRCDLNLSNPCSSNSCSRRANKTECSKSGGHICSNQRLQDFSVENSKVEIYQTGNIGRGIRAIVPIADGEIITEYFGVFTTKDEFKQIHNTEYGKYSIKCMNDCYLDLEDSGFHARLANCSCEPNSCLVELFVDRQPRYVLEAQEDIEVGDPITVSYGGQYSLQNCQCGSKNCKSKNHVDEDESQS